MDSTTVERLKRLAPQIQQFLELHPDEQAWLLLLLGRAERRAIAVLKAIQGEYLSYQEIAEEVECHPSTVKQIIYALSAGGVLLLSDKSERWMTPAGGRNRKLTRIQ
jgi:hypothetical protein